MGDWKLLRFDPNPWRLYNLAEDIHEDHDLAAQNPEVVRALTEAYGAWESEMIPPRWKIRRPLSFEVAGETITVQP
jgi:hypothetical protein